MKTDDFDFQLPRELIASRPLEGRSDSRMMVLDPAGGTISHRAFAEFPQLLAKGDLLVLNDTRVVPARFFSDDGKKELLRLDDMGGGRWRCMVRPGKKLRVGHEIVIAGRRGEVMAILEDGTREILFEEAPDPEAHGKLALPPYMDREEDGADRERYQTVYAGDQAGSVAAPTAGLHFTEEILSEIDHAFLTLHVGPGTFKPVDVEEITDHRMHAEVFDIPEETAQRVAGAERVVAVGTTSCRSLEHQASRHGKVVAGAGETDIFIHPGHEFRAVGGLLTNFHLPKSTLIMLVAALAGHELTMEAYAEAVREEYRFYSYGDCMLIL